MAPRSLLWASIVGAVMLTTACASTSTPTTTTTMATDPTPTTSVAGSSDPSTLFVDGALTSAASIVDCTLENGSASTCYQFEVASLSSTVDTAGPYCPATTSDIGGIWVWDGDSPGLYELDADFWDLMAAQGYDFVDASGNITITDPGAGAASGGATENSCLEATPDGSYHLQVLIPMTPELLDTPTDLSVISQVGIAFDGVTIFGDAPSVADRGGLPALDACGGHIDPSGYYHFHFGAESIESNFAEAGIDLTCAIAQDTEAPVGLAYDGYMIFGPEEDGTVPTDLDACNGHTSTTAYGTTYHYHLSTDSPNLPLCRVGAAADGKLTSPDGEGITLPDGDQGAGGPPAGGPNG